jgi:predicted ribonuclease YlaK
MRRAAMHVKSGVISYSLRQNGSLQDGVKTEHGGTIQITVNNEVTSAASKLFFLDRNDNLIIGTALYFKDKYPDSIVTLSQKMPMSASKRIA